VEHLSAEEKSNLIPIICHILQALEETGLDRGGSTLSMLWPDGSNIVYGVKSRCDSSNNPWGRMLQDSISCATFAAITTLCFESGNCKCKSLQGQNGTRKACGEPCLSTAVSRYIPAMSPSSGSEESVWGLRHGRKYWLGSVGSHLLLEVIPELPEKARHLTVRSNRFPNMIAKKLGFGILRERQDNDFEGEDVLVL